LTDSTSFVLSVDELGSYLVVDACELVIGHIGGAGVDLPFLADVGARHAVLSRQLSFRDGLIWRIAPLGEEQVSVGGDVVAEGGHSLVHNDRVTLGVNLSFRYSQPDPGSTTAVLELLQAAECFGNRAIVLQNEGESGKLRLGRSSLCHLRVETLAEETKLSRLGSKLWIDGVHRAFGEAKPTESGGAVGIELPLQRRADFQIKTVTGTGPACGIALAPLPSP
jgi:hypothetical protein